MFVWFMLGAPQCKSKVRELIERADTAVFVSAATAWELATKVRLGKWPEGEGVLRRLHDVLADHDFTSLPVSIEHGRVAGMFETPHKDPFDRMLAAQSHVEDMPLVTADRALQTFGIQTLW